MQCGDAFMLEDEDAVKEHLHVLVITPTDRDEVITVPICTRQRWSELLVSLEVGDHPFLRHSSFVSFRHARIRKGEGIKNAIEKGLARKMEAVSPEILRRIQNAFLESEHVANDVREFFKEVMGI
jgi:hypothetical protein